MLELAIVHDDFPDPLKPFLGSDVRLVRPMSPASSIYTALPPRMAYTYDNEDDHEDRSWRPTYASKVKQGRPDLYLVCPAEKPTERDQYDPEEIALCDAIGIHIAVYEDPSAWAFLKDYGKPIWILEVEADPAEPDQMALLVPAARAHIAAGAACAFLWGSDPYHADVNDHPVILAQARAYNLIYFKGGPMAVDPTVQQVLDQNALIADALYDVVKIISQYPSSQSAPFVDAVQDAKTKVNALNPAKFTFP